MRKATKKNNVTLREKTLSNGNISLYLDIYRDGERKYEFLKLYINSKARTPIDRELNRKNRLRAEEIRTKRESDLNNNAFGLKDYSDQNINFITYFQNYIDNYTKKDIRMMQIALQRFKDFLSETKEYSKFALSIKPYQIDKDMMNLFVEYLQNRSIGEGAKSIYQRFKKVINYAIEHDVIIKNPCIGVKCKVDDQILRKDILSPDEITALINCHYDNENDNIRRAFIFCLYCGLRFCDVKDLAYKNIDYSNKLLKFEQKKTQGHSATSGVVIPLNNGILSLIGEPPANGNKDMLIFPLPTYESCLKSLKRWVKRAGIDKHISWHCARHSFALNILNNGANIKTVASLLGHSGLKHTEKYVRAVDKLKEEAINSLPELKL